MAYEAPGSKPLPCLPYVTSAGLDLRPKVDTKPMGGARMRSSVIGCSTLGLVDKLTSRHHHHLESFGRSCRLADAEALQHKLAAAGKITIYGP
jgi:hypothetical protein